jgi:Ca-activated chloride channel family protein
MTEPSTLLLRIVAVAALVLPTLGIVLHLRRRRAAAASIGEPRLVEELLGVDLTRIPGLRYALIGIAVVALSLAVLDPALATAAFRRQGPLVLALDASGSMLAEDVEGSRIEAQRRIARSFVAALPDRAWGVVAFAGRAFSLTPPTRDLGALEMYLAAVHPSIVTQSGSSVAAAIRQGLGLLAAGGDPSGGTIVLMGDGDDTEDPAAAIEAATLARKAGVIIHSVGVGGDQGAPVPSVDLASGAVTGYMRDPDGQVIVSRRVEALLREIAQQSGGVYVDGHEPGAVAAIVDRVEGSPAGRDPIEENRLPLYAWLSLAALLCLALEPLASDARRKKT